MKSLQRAFLCGVSFAAFVLPAMAQESLETVTVTGFRTSLRDSLEMKQKSSLITENISTKDIGQLPDVTIGEELNRLPGVNTQRDRGNASQVAIRGLGPRFVFGLVNGREVASSEPTQNVRYESYPSEILSGAQVYKTQDASLIGGGIAATIDIRTAAPLDYNGPVLQARVGSSYYTEAARYDHYSPVGWRGSVGVNYHLSDNFAFSLAGSAQRQKNGYPNLSFWTENTNQPDTGWGNPSNLTGRDPTKVVTLPNGTTGLSGGNPAPWGAAMEMKFLQQDRYGLAGAAEWKVNEKLRIKADALVSSYIISEDQSQQYYAQNGKWANNNWSDDWSNCNAANTYLTAAQLAACQQSNYAFGNNGIPGGPSTGSPYLANGSTFKVDGMGHVVSANLVGAWPNVQNVIARYAQRQTLIVSGLNFDYNDGAWNAKLDLSHSEAWRNNQWLAVRTADQWFADSSFNMEQGSAPYVTIGGNPSVPANNTSVSYPYNVGPEQTRDHVSAIAGDVSRDFEGSFISKISAGMRWSARAKTHHKWDYWYDGSGTLAASALDPFQVEGYNVPKMLWGDWDAIKSSVLRNPTLTNTDWSTGTVGGANASNGFRNMILDWKVQETSTSGYLKADFHQDVGGVPVDGGIGVRVEDLKTVSTGWTSDSSQHLVAARFSNRYTDALPSLYLNAHVADDQMIRFGASMAVSRPPLDTLNTGYALTTTSLGGQPPAGSGGNPMLKPFRATNIDLDYEWFFHEESMVSVAGYYKRIMNYIGSGITPMVLNGSTYNVTTPVNGKGGDLYGVEGVFQTRFYFLPGFLQDFGIYANASMVDSNIKEFHPILTPYSMAGMAHNSDEIDLWYSKAGFEARVAMKYHSSFTMIPGWDSQQLDTLDPETTIDFIASYQLNDSIGLRFQAMNLTDQITRISGARQGDAVLRGSNDPNDLAGYSRFGRTLSLEVSYKM